MNWFYVTDGQRQGPVDETEFNRLVAAGTIGPETLVWREGMPEWRAYRLVALMGVSAQAAQAAPVYSEAAPGTGQVNCSECGRVFPADQVLDYGGKKICADCKPAFFQHMREAGEAAALADMNYAGFWIRFAAKFIDGIITNIVSALAQAVVGLSMFNPQRNAEMMEEQLGMFIMFAYVVPMVFGFTYYVWMNGKYGATLGKMAVGIKIVRSDGSKLSYGRAFGRMWAEVVSGMICYVGYIMAGFDNPEKRALHDRMCDTRVVYKKK